MKVAIYSRYSTDQQDKTSIAGQIANCEALTSREGLEIVARFHDEGRSGNDDQRPNYQAMLKGLKRGDFAGIVADETSRFTRNQAELHRLVAELRFRDQFMVTADGVDTRNEMSEIVLSVKSAIDAMEGRKIGFRTYRSLRERHKDGHSAGGRIYGYSSIQDGDYRRRVVAEDQAAVVREIFERYANGESSKAIARILNERGVPSPGTYWELKKRRAAGWSHTTICGSHAKAAGILRNPIYRGVHTWNKRRGRKVPGTAQRLQTRRPDSEWIEHRDESLRIVSDELWNAVQMRLSRARERCHPKNKRGRPARYLLSGLMTCSSCGGHYVLRNGRDYSCSSHTNGRDSLCSQKRILRKSYVEDAMLRGVKEIYLSPKLIREMTACVQKRLRREPDKGALKIELARLDRQIEAAISTLMEVGASKALTTKLRQLEERKTLLEAQKIQSRPDIVPNVSVRLRELVENLETIPSNPHYDADLMHKTRQALKALVGDAVVVEDDDGVFAEIKVGRALLCINDSYDGAEERT